MDLSQASVDEFELADAHDDDVEGAEAVQHGAGDPDAGTDVEADASPVDLGVEGNVVDRAVIALDLEFAEGVLVGDDRALDTLDPTGIEAIVDALRIGESLAMRVVVACVGAELRDGEKVKRAPVGGVTSEGMLCDGPMLGWAGGGQGTAALLPERFAPGDAPPSSRPRADGAAESSADASSPAAPVAKSTGPGVDALFEKKMSKEEKKAALAAKRAAKKAAKEAAEGDEKGDEGDDDDGAP